ncbi:hypothetical protein B0G69_7566 [Paraburkholderia sp. RAU2J]|uniref:hypothetical protein n=1 Tax=Paraburkholderia sp. RAU2J TaxID=1938810 RepID=UPI000F256A56|nr:hypothetical protein [Paraburkholderia sp. RAU2J]RKT14309.1 hypothetical protein B0G69_7566 [Paraburkholderia sp. RAU2J]
MNVQRKAITDPAWWGAGRDDSRAGRAWLTRSNWSRWPWAGCAPESLPPAVKRMGADCWPGMSRAQLVARARRRALQPSLRAAGDNPGTSAPSETGHFGLTVTVDGNEVRLVAHLRRIPKRRRPARPLRASKLPARDPRQGDLF